MTNEAVRSAGRLGARASLEDVRLLGVSAMQAPPTSLDHSAAEVRIERTAKAMHDADTVAVIVEYDIRADRPSLAETDVEDAEPPLLSIDAAWLLVYSVPAEASFTQEELDDFGRMMGTFAAHPYMRVLAHDLTGRMGLPPLVLDLLKSPIAAWETTATED